MPRKSNTANHNHDDNIIVHDHDVLNGRGVNIAQHPGNLRFRALIKSHADQSYCTDYSTSAKKALAEEIIHHIQNLDPPGRFLKRPSRAKKSSEVESGPWEELSYRETLKKACQALRDCNRGDRAEYARHIEAPQDVQVSHHQRQQTGLTKRQYAERKGDAFLARNPMGPYPNSATARPNLHVDTSAVGGPPDHVASYHHTSTTATSKQHALATPATAATSSTASAGSVGSFHYFHERPHAALSAFDHFSHSPPSGIEYDPFHLEEEQKLAAMARESINMNGDFDEGHESVLERPDEGTDFSTVFDGDITI